VREAAAYAAASHSLPNRRFHLNENADKVEFEGEVIEALRGRMFRIQLDNGHETLGYLGGRLKRYRIRVMLGDRVRVELSPYDITRGRIVYRLG
jgi:translation initiation factor IF-1